MRETTRLAPNRHEALMIVIIWIFGNEVRDEPLGRWTAEEIGLVRFMAAALIVSSNSRSATQSARYRRRRNLQAFPSSLALQVVRRPNWSTERSREIRPCSPSRDMVCRECHILRPRD